jgi:hypothetical protein
LIARFFCTTCSRIVYSVPEDSCPVCSSELVIMGDNGGSKHEEILAVVEPIQIPHAEQEEGQEEVAGPA